MVSFTEIEEFYRIEHRIFDSLALESKLMMQYTIGQLVEERAKRIELEERLEENGIFEFPQKTNGK